MDSTVDVGLAIASGELLQVNLIEGDIYSGVVSSKIDTVKKVGKALPMITS